MDEIPFNLKERKTANKNSVFNIYFDHLVKDEDSLVEDYLVVEPKIKKEDGVSGVAILPVKDNYIGLIKIYRHAVSCFGWEVPRGFVDENENPDDAALRELNEETGLSCKLNNLKNLGCIYPEPGVISAKVKLYVANISVIEANEISEEMGCVGFAWFSKKEVESLIGESQVCDATTISTYYKAAVLKFDI